MRMKSRLGFLVLLISFVSTGETQTTASPLGGYETVDNEGSSTLKVPQSLNETRHEANVSIATNQSSASVETVSTPLAGTPDNETTTEGSMSASVHVTTVSKTTVLTPAPTITPDDEDDEDEDTPSSWGYVFLVMIILVIIFLCVILYFLRRASRTYSFDLHRPGPVDHLNLPIGTFEPVYLDDLEQPTPKENTTTDEAPPTANGTNQTEEKSSNGLNAAQEHLDVNGLETSPTSNTSNTSNSSELPDADPVEPVEPLDVPSLMFEAEEQQNENNNNNPFCSNEPFVEINLDDPVWSDQLITSCPPSSSSVLPFSPFSFSSSSSSS